MPGVNFESLQHDPKSITFIALTRSTANSLNPTVPENKPDAFSDPDKEPLQPIGLQPN